MATLSRLRAVLGVLAWLRAEVAHHAHELEAGRGLPWFARLLLRGHLFNSGLHSLAAGYFRRAADYREGAERTAIEARAARHSNTADICSVRALSVLDRFGSPASHNLGGS